MKKVTLGMANKSSPSVVGVSVLAIHKAATMDMLPKIQIQ